MHMTKRFFTLLLLLCATCLLHAANYLTFTAETENSSFGIKNRSGYQSNIQYSLDEGMTWNTLKNDTLIKLPQKGNKALLKGENIDQLAQEGYTYFVMTGKIAASGSVMSLLDGTGDKETNVGRFCFIYLFRDCASLTQAPELPATGLSQNCYSCMFMNCTNLTQAPQLPTTELASFCYSSMFTNCTNLTLAPQLPATELAEGCYHSMFNGCSKLVQAPQLPAKEIAKLCYYSMFENCVSLTKAPQLPATQLAEGCYAGMFEGCTKLTKAPELPATKLYEDCYFNMFANCTHLTQTPKLPKLPQGEKSYKYFEGIFNNCPNTQQDKVINEEIRTVE